MSTSVAAMLARSSRAGLCAAIALALGLTCVAFAVAASITPMTGMAGMAGTSATAVVAAAPADAVGAHTLGPTGADSGVARNAASPVGSVTSTPTSSVCDSACVSAVGELCTAAAGPAVVTLLALLLAARRDTYLGLLARTRPHALRRQRPQSARTALSPLALCVLRV